MQHTLLPLPQRNYLRREYRIRIFIVFLFMISLAGIIGAGTLFPAFLFGLNEEKTQLNMVASLKKDKSDSGLAVVEKELSIDSSLLSVLAEKSSIPSSSNLIQSIVNLRGPVKIDSMSLSEQGTSTIAIVLQGLAPNREAVLSFKSRLEDLVLNGSVDLPISDLAQSRDFRFTIKINQSFP